MCFILFIKYICNNTTLLFLLFTGSCEKYHSSYSIHQCDYLSCLCFGNLEDGFWVQQDIIELLNVSLHQFFNFINKWSEYSSWKPQLFSCVNSFSINLFIVKFMAPILDTDYTEIVIITSLLPSVCPAKYGISQVWVESALLLFCAYLLYFCLPHLILIWFDLIFIFFLVSLNFLSIIWSWTYLFIIVIFCYRYNGVEGLHTKVTEFVRDKDCLVCGPGVLIELDTSITLRKVNLFSFFSISFVALFILVSTVFDS